MVPNRNGPGKKIVKRPRPPPTSPPLDDEFDAMTHAGTTAKAPETELFSHPQRSEQTRATSPPIDNNDGHKRSVSSPEPDAVRKREFNLRPSSPAQSFVENTPNMPQRRKGKARDEGFERYGGYENYMTEMERMFGGRGDLDLSVKLLGVEPNRESYQLGRVKSGGTARSRRAIVSPRGPHAEPPDSVEDHGPKAGQTYEVVNRQVVEDGPDRTVTIATWREQVAREANPEIDTMSVYYVSAEDYARDDVNEYVDGMETEVETHVTKSLSGKEVLELEEGSRAPSRPDDRNALEQVPLRPVLSPNQHEERPPTPPQKDWRRPMYTEHSHTRDGTALPQRGNRIPPRALTPDRRSQSGTTSSVRSPVGKQPAMSYGMTPPSPPRTSTPVQNSPLSSSHGNVPHESTPITGRMPKGPFHPTASGSTITSIKSSSSDSLAFERILESCRPSIVHIAPMLASLGITSEEHLAAIARLSPDTRDREVKDEALRLGVTVMEWAILVDRLLSL